MQEGEQTLGVAIGSFLIGLPVEVVQCYLGQIISLGFDPHVFHYVVPGNTSGY